MLSEKPWQPEAVMLLVSGLCLSLFIGMAGQIVLIHALPDLGEPLKKLISFFASITVFHVVALVLTAVFLKAHQMSWWDFVGLRQRILLRALLQALIVGVVLVPLALALNSAAAEVMKLVGLTPELQPTIKVLQESGSLPRRLSFAVAAVLLAPVVEESLFRGILYPAIKQQGFPKTALLGTSLLFAAIHVNLMTFLPLTVFALVMVFLYEKTDTLLAPIFAHCLFNGANFCMFFFQSEVDRWLQRVV